MCLLPRFGDPSEVKRLGLLAMTECRRSTRFSHPDDRLIYLQESQLELNEERQPSIKISVSLQLRMLQHVGVSENRGP